MSNPCIILEISDIEGWSGAFQGSKRIPEDHRSTTLQPSREIAEEEAKRLAMQWPGKHFAVFEASVLAKSVEIPSHVTVSGKVWGMRRQAVLLAIDDSEVPF